MLLEPKRMFIPVTLTNHASRIKIALARYFGRRHRCLAARRSDKLTLDRIVDSLHHPLSEQDVVKQLYYQDISILPPDTLFFLREKWLPYVAS